MATAIPFSPIRRRLLQGLGAGLVIGVWLPPLARAQSGEAEVLAGTVTGPLPGPNAFVRIAADDTVTVLIKHIEFGQGPYTGLATLVAEELDADWSQMRAEAAPADVKLYANLAFGIQGTGGSTAMANSFEQMRRAGAAARAMLIAAAAAAWSVPASDITIERGVVSHAASGRTARFGALASAAQAMPVPTDVVLKSPAQFRLIGTRLPRLDTHDKTTGAAQFTIDVHRPGMLTVVVLHPDKFGARVATVDDAAARAVPGVVEVRIVPQGVAVYARSTHAAIKGRRALTVQWDESAAETRSTPELFERYRAEATRTGAIAAARGEVEAHLSDTGSVLEGVYEFPYLAHAPMEPLDAVLALEKGAAEVFMGTQLQTVDRATIAKVLELPEERVTLHTLLAGGSFGRRAQPDSGFAAEAATVLKALGRDGVVKLLWTREDDLRGGRYRPMAVHRLRAALAADGSVAAWDQTIATQSIMAGSPFAGMIKNDIDPTSCEGAIDMPYGIPHFRVSLHTMQVGVPPLWWRSVGHSHTAYAVETFLDELLERGGRDPVAGRIALLGDNARHRAVLERAAALADAGGPVPAGRARGIAVHKSFNSYVAQVAEVSKGEDGLPRVHRVWCAVDCGLAVNPDIIVAQMESGIGYGLGAALYGAITLEAGGRVHESNFDTYRSLRLPEMPAIEVAIVPSSEAPTGVGEPGTPPIAPAVANAFRRLTGVATRRLPFSAAVAPS